MVQIFHKASVKNAVLPDLQLKDQILQYLLDPCHHFDQFSRLKEVSYFHISIQGTNDLQFSDLNL